MPIDFSKRYSDYARFTPAISEMYTRYVVSENPKRYPPVTQQELDFLSPNGSLFHLPCALYSAGQAAKSKNAAHKKDMVTDRDRSITTVLGDSGGFQIQTGAIKFEGDATRERMMRWMEQNCDWSMVLDFPTGGIAMGNIKQHLRRLEGDQWHRDDQGNQILDKDGNPVPNPLPDWGNKQALDDLIIKNGGKIDNDEDRQFYACMLQTIINNDYFIKHREPGATKFLNVIQGRNPKESKIWYDNVKHYKFEGWSLASHHKENFVMTLHRIVDMLEDGLLTDKDWMHFLGVGKFQHGCVYTTLQREIRKKANNPRFTISYDVSSPFTLAAYGKVFVGYDLSPDSWSIQGEKLDGRHYLPTNTYVDDDGVEQIGHEMLGTGKGRVKYKLDDDGNKIPLPPVGPESNRPFLDVLRDMFDERLGESSGGRFIETEVGKKLNMGDICVNVDPKFTSTWDVVSYALLMNHNVQVHLEGVYESQALYDASDPEHPTYNPLAVSQVPLELRQIRQAIRDIFASDDPRSAIDEYSSILQAIAGENATKGVLQLELFELAETKEHQASLKDKKSWEKQAEPVPTDSFKPGYDSDTFNFG